MNRTKFVHMEYDVGRKKKGVVTAAIVRGDNEFVKIGFSFCSPKDQWNRKYGNMLACYRAAVGAKYSTVAVLDPDDHPIDQINELVKKRLTIPRWLTRWYEKNSTDFVNS